MDLNKEPPMYPTIYDSWDAYARSVQRQAMDGREGARDTATGIFGAYNSCGISQLAGLGESTSEEIVNKVLIKRASTDNKTIKEAFVTFSDTYRSQYGRDLCQYIRDNKLGNIAEFGPRMNPNTGNMIMLWVWEPPHVSLNPTDRYLPVYGKEFLKDRYGNICGYKDPEPKDPRFQSRLTGTVNGA
jgi:hypothetical protein